MSIEDQPISRVQWVDREDLSANDWNPNKQAPPEHRLLKTSILENGWTQPIVVRQQPSGLEIVDGFHRWTVSADGAIAALTGGPVPIVTLPPTDPVLARLATVRHNRARGTHHVLGMADIVADLLGLGLTHEEIGRRLEMDAEEVDRLADRGDMRKRGGQDSFGNGWTV
ncbi:ParB/RepB/Spo0J family partition protein [Actinoallomurus vinaceus]|uniref:ParB/RepB/Spo0J family partition protein n=1 Tax=Actinoallomurus vinaceus TaxID=1080074 RepID=A0ABP8UAW5_9ACTN